MRKTGTVIYLDLLGFKGYVKKDSEVALELLRNFHEVLKLRQQQQHLSTVRLAKEAGNQREHAGLGAVLPQDQHAGGRGIAKERPVAAP